MSNGHVSSRDIHPTMGNAISRTVAVTTRQVARTSASTSAAALPAAGDALDTTTTPPTVGARPIAAILLLRPSIFNRFRGPRTVPEGMVSIITPRDGTALLSDELASSLSARYRAAFSNGMRESIERSILETIDMPRGVWGTLFSALAGTPATAFNNANQSLSVLELLDYLDPDNTFLTSRGNAAMHTLAQRALRSLPALCARKDNDVEAKVSAFQWSLLFEDAEVRETMAGQLAAKISLLPNIVEHIDTEVLAAMLQEPPFKVRSRNSGVRRFVEAWARVHDDAKLSAILDGTYTGKPSATAFKVPTQARPLAYLDHWQQAKRLMANPHRPGVYMLTEDGAWRVFDARGRRREIDVPLSRVHDAMVRGDITVFAGHTPIPGGDGHSVIILQKSAAPHIVHNACCVAIDLDDTHLAEGFANGVINLRDLQTKQVVGSRYRGLVGGVTKVTLGEQLVCGQTDRDHLRVWDRESGTCVFEMGDVASYVLHEDMLIVNAAPGRTSVWANWNGTFLHVRTFASSVYERGLVTDGVRLIAASSLSLGNHVVETRDLVSGECVQTLGVQGDGALTTFQLMPDGFALGTDRGEFWLLTASSSDA